MSKAASELKQAIKTAKAIGTAGINSEVHISPETATSALKSLEAWQAAKAEIQSELIIREQIIDGEYFADEAEQINSGLNKALEILEKYIQEVEETA